MVMRASFESVPPASLDFALAWFMREAVEEQHHRRVEQAHLLGLIVNINDAADDFVAMQSSRHG
jgi:hypothetical protein